MAVRPLPYEIRKKDGTAWRPTVALNRTEQGNPKAIVSSGNKNMLGQNRMSTTSPNLGLSAPEKVKMLIDFGMEQLTWVHPKELGKVCKTRLAEPPGGAFAVEMPQYGTRGLT